MIMKLSAEVLMMLLEKLFDKAAKLLNLAYPGGPVIDKIAQNGNPNFFAFPQAFKQKNNYNFSYSGLKTAIKNYLNSFE